MIFTRVFVVLLTYVTMAFHREADQCSPPTGLSYKWLDDFTVNVSWEKPNGLTDDKDIEFEISRADGDSEQPSRIMQVTWRNFTDIFFTEKKHSDKRTYKIRDVSKDCNRSDENIPANITIRTQKPRAELVKDFRCVIYPKKMNCSWIPANPSLNLSFSYRMCGQSEDCIKSIKKCDQPYVSGDRSGCFLHDYATNLDICILVETDTLMSTFKILEEKPLLVPPPELNVTEDGDFLKLSWTTPEIGENNCWTYEVYYKQCNEVKKLRRTANGESTMEVPYDKSCHYEFKVRALNTNYIFRLSSSYSEVVSYATVDGSQHSPSLEKQRGVPALKLSNVPLWSGSATKGTNESPDRTLTVVAIVIPIILSLCVILSCYCLRRHSAIICPIIPDPSAIFKEMMMNGNKELKTAPGSLYTPVPEPIEPCKITLVTENSSLQENS